MKVIEPIQPDESTLTSSTVAESTETLWASGTSYAVGDKARRWRDGAYRIYEALIANDGQDPATDPTNSEGLPYWLDTGATNRWAMFDGSVNSPTTQDDGQPLVVEYTPAGRVGAVALFEVAGNDVTVEMSSAIGGGVVYSETVSTTGSRGPGWWAYLFGGATTRRRFVFEGMPPYPDAVITLTVTPAGGSAAVGEAVYGTLFEIGEDTLGMEPSLKSYSTNEFDRTFGYNVKVKRASRRRLRTEVAVPAARADAVFDKMQELLDVNAVYISDKFESGQLYGFCREYAPVHSTHPIVYSRLKIEGLI